MEGNCSHIDAGVTEETQRIISPTTWKFLRKGYYFNRWFPFHPYRWDEATKGPKVVTGFVPIFIWHLHLLSVIIFYGILVYRSIQVTVLQPGSRMEQIYVLFVTLINSVFITTQIHAALNRHQIVNMMQGFYLLTAKCEGKSL